jgi:hypothetical protein
LFCVFVFYLHDTPCSNANRICITKGTNTNKKIATSSRKLPSRPMFGLFVSSQLFVCLESWGGTSFSKNAIGRFNFTSSKFLREKVVSQPKFGLCTSNTRRTRKTRKFSYTRNLQLCSRNISRTKVETFGWHFFSEIGNISRTNVIFLPFHFPHPFNNIFS